MYFEILIVFNQKDWFVKAISIITICTRGHNAVQLHRTTQDSKLDQSQTLSMVCRMAHIESKQWIQ